MQFDVTAVLNMICTSNSMLRGEADHFKLNWLAEKARLKREREAAKAAPAQNTTEEELNQDVTRVRSLSNDLDRVEQVDWHDVFVGLEMHS